MSRRKKGKRRPGRIETVEEPTRSKGGSVVPLRPPGAPAAAGSASGAPSPAAVRIQEIRSAIERGSSKAALEKAKLLHKEMPTNEAKAVLIDAYLARIEAMSAKDLTTEAKALTDLVVSRFPEAAARLSGVQRDLAALTGDVAAVVAPLADPNVSPEKRQESEQAIRHALVDLQALATCAALPEDHPLRTAAAALARAFAAVTSGEVDDDAVSLPEVSHRSPLADWKHLIRAIQALYRGRDDDCRRFLAAIHGNSAPSRVVEPIRAILTESSDAELTHGGRILVQRVLGPRAELRMALRALDAAFSRGPSRELYRQIRQASLACERACPPLAKRLKQHISVKAAMANCPVGTVIDALGGPAVHDAYFWRLFARAVEGDDDFAHACLLWDHFRETAIQEGLFRADGQENAFLYLHMAEILRHIPPEHLPDIQEDCREDLESRPDFDGVTPYARTSRSRPEPDLYFLYPEKLYERAAKLRADPNIYNEWFAYAKTADLRDVKPDDVAQQWAAAFPQDVRPLLHLAEAAEQRNAFDKALKFIRQAEELGGIDPKVRRARFRLLAAKAVRHLKQVKPHLAARDLDQLEQLPQAAEKDRPAFVASLRWISALLEGNHDEAERLHGRIQEILEGPLPTTIVLLSTARECGYLSAETSRLEKWLTGYKEPDLIQAMIRVYPIGTDVDVTILLSGKWESLLVKWFKRSDRGLDTKDLQTLTEAALAYGWREVAYHCSGYGLQGGGPERARFLLLRGRSLPYSVDLRRQECFAAATVLAQRARDMDLVAEIADAARDSAGSWGWSDPFAPDWSNRGMDDPALQGVIELERQTRKYPKESRRPFYDIGRDRPEDLCQCPECRRARGETRGYEAPPRGKTRRPTPSPEYLFDDFDEESDEELEAYEQAASGLGPIPADVGILMTEIIRLNGGRLPTTKKEMERLTRRHPELALRLEEVLGRMSEAGLGPLDEFGPDDEPWDIGGEPPRPPRSPGNRGRRKRRR